MNPAEYRVRMFAPDRWGSLERFQHFHSETYAFDKRTQKALPGTANHLHKAWLLQQVARDRAPLLQEDREQVETSGHTRARRGRELSAVVEAALLDLYSSVDCTRQVITSIYAKHRGVKQSTRKFFAACSKGEVAETVPEPIRTAFGSADWYPEVLRLRDALTHSDVGICHLDRATGKATYLHPGLSDGNKALVIDDVLLYLDQLTTKINRFLGAVFSHLNKTLNDKEVWQVCGIFGGRIYSRLVRPSEAVDFNSGRCDAFKWFDKPGNPRCPFAETCDAYRRRAGEADRQN